jgi:dihydrofolate reductase
MRKLIVGTFLTIDGVMQAPGGPGEDEEGGFQHGGWSVNYWDESMGELMTGWVDDADALLLGRKTYEIFAAHWPNVTGEDPTAAKLNSVPKYVASRTLDQVTWNNSTLIKGDVAEAVAKLKEEPGGEIQVHGSGDLAQTLIANDLVDEFRLWVFPVVVGEGKRLFGRGTVPRAFKLVDTKTSSTGVLSQVYERGGAIAYGTFEVDEAGATSKLWEKEEVQR